MADLYAATISGDSAYTVGGNTKRIFPTSEMGTPKITPVIINTDNETLPSGNSLWADNDTDAGNYSITSDFQTQGDVFLAVQAIQQFCEIYEVGGSSNSNYLTVMCRDSNIPYDAGTTFQNDGSTITKLQTAVRAALGGAAVLVQIGRIVDDDTDG
jgi:hypothetical protein